MATKHDTGACPRRCRDTWLIRIADFVVAAASGCGVPSRYRSFARVHARGSGSAGRAAQPPVTAAIGM